MRLGIYGYGNLGKAAELNVPVFPDIELVGVFTRRNPATVKTCGAPVYSASEIGKFKDSIDVLLVAGGSAKDLPVLTPELANSFNVVDSFDTHANIPVHFDAVNAASLASGHTALTSGGWDPGLFSLARIFFQSVLPEGDTSTFWGRGVSQGHSDAIRRIEGVANAKQYTIPKAQMLAAAKAGQTVPSDSKQTHIRECFVVAKPGADLARIENEIRTMPNYFAGYETVIHFIGEEEFAANHTAMPHAGSVIRTGKAAGTAQVVSFDLNLESNPAFTSSVLLAYCRAINRLHSERKYGCFTVFDIAPRYLSPLSDEELRAHCL